MLAGSTLTLVVRISGELLVALTLARLRLVPTDREVAPIELVVEVLELIVVNELVRQQTAYLEVGVEVGVVPAVDAAQNSPGRQQTPEELLDRDANAINLGVRSALLLGDVPLLGHDAALSRCLICGSDVALVTADRPEAILHIVRQGMVLGGRLEQIRKVLLEVALVIGEVVDRGDGARRSKQTVMGRVRGYSDFVLDAVDMVLLVAIGLRLLERRLRAEGLGRMGVDEQSDFGMIGADEGLRPDARVEPARAQRGEQNGAHARKVVLEARGGDAERAGDLVEVFARRVRPDEVAQQRVHPRRCRTRAAATDSRNVRRHGLVDGRNLRTRHGGELLGERVGGERLPNGAVRRFLLVDVDKGAVEGQNLSDGCILPLCNGVE